MKRRCSAAAFAACFVARAAAAQVPQQQDETADRLYVEGKALAQQGDYAAACSKFEESQKREAAIGTQYNLADCYEHTRRPASAMSLYREVARIAQMTGKHDRQHVAEERIAALEKSAPRIVVRFTTTAPTDARVARDGTAIALTEATTGTFVDPGDHVVRVEASGYRAWESQVHVDDGAVRTEVAVPALVAESTDSGVAPSLERTQIGTRPLRVAAIAVSGAGIVAIAVGSIFGVSAISKKNDAGCNGTDCRAAGAGASSELHDAKDAGNIATVLFIAGGVLLAAGVTLFFVEPKPPSNRASIGFRGQGFEATW